MLVIHRCKRSQRYSRGCAHASLSSARGSSFFGERIATSPFRRMEVCMTEMFDAILPGSRWKAFLPRAALNGGSSTPKWGGACAVRHRAWRFARGDRAGARRRRSRDHRLRCGTERDAELSARRSRSGEALRGREDQGGHAFICRPLMRMQHL
jgi:hypothetical protein